MKKRALSLALGLAVAANVASAAQYHQPGSFYLPVSFGLYSPSSESDLGRSAIGNIGLGYNLTHVISVQGLFGVFNPQDNRYNVHRTSTLARLEALVHVPTGHPLEPYFGMGMGLVHMRSSHFMIDFALGTEYHLSQNTALSLNWRYIRRTNGSQGGYMLTGGLTWQFGGTAEIPTASAAQSSALNQNQEKMMQKAKVVLKPYLPEGVKRCQGDIYNDDSGCVTIKGDHMTMHLYVQFKQNKSKIRSQYEGPVNRLARFMQAYPSTDALLRGYASSEGPLGYNDRLSQKRANAAKQYLLKYKGIAANRLTATGFGISSPLANNETEHGRQLNRRVQASIEVPLKRMQQPA